MNNNESLARLWLQHPHRRFKRILFVTYQFNFTWFHNVVLPELRGAALDQAEVLVLATRNDDQTHGDLYNLGEWAQWAKRGLRFRRHYVTTKNFLLHTKFILVEWDDRRRPKGASHFMLGYGSANLTPSGWSENLETWHWTDDYSELTTCRSFLEHLCAKDSGLTAFCSPWLTQLPKSTKGRDWLFGSKRIAQKDAFSRLAQSYQGSPAVLRIVSPYWDNASSSIISELLANFGSDRPRLIELWVDESRRLARRSDYSVVLDILDSWTNPEPLAVKTVRVSDGSAVPHSVVPLHAKLIEIEGSKGKATRIFGSANFTGKAWLSGYNLETIGFIDNAAPFPKLLQKSPFKLSEHTITRNGLKKLIDASDPDEASLNGGDARPWINWATLDESDAQCIVSVSYQTNDSAIDNKDAAVNYLFDADFHPTRALDRKTNNAPLLNQIKCAYSDPNNWTTLHQEPTLLKVKYVGPALSLPETLSIRLEFGEGVFVSAGVEIHQPDFEGQRDTNTGIPLVADLEGILVGRKPVVPPIPKISNEESLDDSDDEEEELSDVPEVDETLASIPDFDRLPSIERAIQIYHRAKQTDLHEVRRLRARATKLCNKMTNTADKLAVRALIKALNSV
jgi:phosphatidylserine/phosphatidylglycerophosphate/cardiolipin synthase-like enzyme